MAGGLIDFGISRPEGGAGIPLKATEHGRIKTHSMAHLFTSMDLQQGGYSRRSCLAER